MKTRKGLLILSLVLVLTGVLVLAAAFAMGGFRLDKIVGVSVYSDPFSLKYSGSQTVAEAYSSIEVHAGACNVFVVYRESGETQVKYTDHERATYEICVENDTLHVRRNDERSGLMRISMPDPVVTLFVNRAELDRAYVKNTSGNAAFLKGVAFESVKVDNTSGNIRVEAAVLKEIDISTNSGEISVMGGGSRAEQCVLKATSGNIDITNLQADTITVKCQSGNIKLYQVKTASLSTDLTSGIMLARDVKAGTASFKNTSGNISLISVIAEKSLFIKSTSGNIIMNDCDAFAIEADLTSGNISGTLLSPKIFTAHTVTGKVKVPQSGGEGTCRINCIRGNIEISIVQ